MTATEIVLERLAQLSALVALVGARIYQVKAPQSATFPLVVVRHISENETLHLRGTNGLLSDRVQVDAYAEESSGADPRAAARAVDAAIRGDGASTGLIGWTGALGSPATTVWAIRPAGVRESYEEQPKKVYRVMRDVFVDYAAG